MILYIPEKISEKIKDLAKNELPNETCGYLAGIDNTIKSIVPMTNADHSPEHFSFMPEEQFAVMRKVRTENLKLLAVYHSHPETPARMSDEDKRLAVDTNMYYLIYSVCENSLKGFSINSEKQVTEITLSIIK